ncbi:uncharacterized protein LOC126899753 [Daktulosphaira vitifoliae]|uniref:uncharacterized protein LOC126899753 n=1 Tax=Daktulosphaira vitifoliae TaxID=58002 RepID=UPI0021A9E3A5|nr:uncharacterized protein LOC126899753 [Daktulosphaira vitifoliae]
MPSSHLLNIPKNINQLSIILPKKQKNLCKPVAIWRLVDSPISEVVVENLNQYLIFVLNGLLSCPIMLSELRGEEFPIPVVFSSFSVEDDPMICVTLSCHNKQHIINILDNQHQHMVLNNFCDHTLIISKNPNCETFSKHWKWIYRIQKNQNSTLSLKGLSNKQFSILYLNKLMGNSKTDLSQLKCLGSIIIKNEECHYLKKISNQNIDVIINKVLFTWNITIKPIIQISKSNHFLSLNSEEKGCLNKEQNSLNDHDVWKNINCYISEISISLFADEIYSNSFLAIKVKDILIYLNSLKDCQNKEYEFILSFGHLQIDNQRYSSSNYKFPSILKTKHNNFQKLVNETTDISNNTSKKFSDVRNTESKFVISSILAKKNNKSIVILDLEISLPKLYVYFEYEFYVLILNHLFMFEKLKFDINDPKVISDDHLPLIQKTYNRNIYQQFMLRKLLLKPFVLNLSISWKNVCHISFDYLQLNFQEFIKINVQMSRKQLFKCLIIHYYTTLIQNVGQVLGLIDLVGAPRNLSCIIRDGISQFIDSSKQGIGQGVAYSIYGIIKDTTIFIIKLADGLYMSVLKFVFSWSKTFIGFQTSQLFDLKLQKSIIQNGVMEKKFYESNLWCNLLLNLNSDDKVLVIAKLKDVIFEKKFQNMVMILTKQFLYFLNEQLECIEKSAMSGVIFLNSDYDLKDIFLNNEASICILKEAKRSNTLDLDEIIDDNIIVFTDTITFNIFEGVIKSYIFKTNNLE